MKVRLVKLGTEKVPDVVLKIRGIAQMIQSDGVEALNLYLTGTQRVVRLDEYTVTVMADDVLAYSDPPEGGW